MVKTNLVKFEETSSMHLSGMDVNGSEDNKNNRWTDNDDEDGYESDQNHSKNDEGDNRVVLESSLNSVILIIVSDSVIIVGKQKNVLASSTFH